MTDTSTAPSDPHGVQQCQHPDCGRYQDGVGWGCRAMADGACARPSGQQPYQPTTAPTPEELAARVASSFALHGVVKRLFCEDIAAAIRQHSAPLEARVAELAAERDRWIADWRGEKAEAERLDEHAGALECTLERVRGELVASQARETAMREALEREAAWNDYEASLCDRQAASFKRERTAEGREMHSRCDAAADAHRKASHRLRAAIQPQEPANAHRS